jgi:dihydroxyacetone kinase-like predicted kinase
MEIKQCNSLEEAREQIDMLDEQIVTLIAGLDAADATTAAIVSWLAAEHPGVEVEVHEGGQPLYPYFLGVE